MLSPYFTIMNYKYNEDVDTLINTLLDENAKVTRDDAWATFTTNKISIKIWIQSRWYGYASLARTVDKTVLGTQIYDRIRPSRKTMSRMYKYIRDNCEYYKNSELKKMLEKLGKNVDEL